MMSATNALQWTTAVALCLAVTACSDGEQVEPVVPGEVLVFGTGNYEIPAGDVFTCFYTDTIAAEDLAVTSATGRQSPGGHHITVYYTNSVREPTSHPCDDQEMLTWNQVAGAAINPEEFTLDIPEGLATRVPAGSQLVLQTHYINTSGQPETVSDDVTLQLAKPEELEAYVNDFVIVDLDLAIAPHSAGESVSICTVPADVPIVRLLGHAHEWGTYFKLERLDDNDEVAEIIYEEDWLPYYSSAPPMNRYPVDAPLTLKEGTRLRQTCRWNNTEEYEMKFPREMCVTYAYYFPDDGRKMCAQD